MPWEGTSPNCGKDSTPIGTTRGHDPQYKLVASTQHQSVGTHGGLDECKSTYGETCWSGWKTLWCQSDEE
ncbi:hypothetical protein P168DRAFT_288011 [Aspergillus campestris IBT 28561]|uniref:Uncharacterized protein n=1 Tax=Aspergillus campestris (strain IBT 28561) TaxID=1392248 RepID=A0A2I1DCE2_ASPC2|nr:uncharacterized protein P168DRAFT_288011 [Aspergillus campestris IBT 28561]PKY07547.1 hypothetical protein P168DRAFT_288011 [Aspergillus campestris IBT 28561]